MTVAHCRLCGFTEGTIVALLYTPGTHIRLPFYSFYRGLVSVLAPRTTSSAPTNIVTGDYFDLYSIHYAAYAAQLICYVTIFLEGVNVPVTLLPPLTGLASYFPPLKKNIYS